jgi:hypothetical protein
MPKLIAKYNITFMDALGREPRILPFEYFHSYKVLQAFIRQEFGGIFPNSSLRWGEGYQLLSSNNSQVLTAQNWGGIVTQGATVKMAVLVRRLLLTSPSTIKVQHCPNKSCPGTLQTMEMPDWTVW